MVKVLQVISNPVVGMSGVEKLWYEYYKYFDKEKIRIDFAFLRKSERENRVPEDLEDFTEAYYLNVLNEKENSIKNYFNLYKRLSEILSQNEYDIIHVNSSVYTQPVCLSVSKRFGVKRYISHSHTSPFLNKHNSAKKILRFFSSRYIVKNADYLFSCSNMANYYMFGGDVIKSEKYVLLKTVINASRFSFNQSKRDEIRRKYCADNSLVIGFVGRLCEQKNPLFLLDVLNELQNIYTDVVLWIIGDGELKGEMQRKMKSLNLCKNVIFWGERNDVEVFMQGMDILIMPSLYEGLSTAVIEAQCSGLPVLVSDSVDKEHAITDGIIFCSLEAEKTVWAEKAKIMLNVERHDRSEEIKMAGFDVEDKAKWLMEFYMTIVK